MTNSKENKDASNISSNTTKKDINKDVKNNNANDFKMLTLISQFGINIIVPVFACFFVGLWIDKKFGTNYWMIILFFVGAFAGFRNVFVLAKKMTNKSSDEINEAKILQGHLEKTEDNKEE